MTEDNPTSTVQAPPTNTDTGAQADGPGVSQYTDGYAYEVPRPFLTLSQAAAYLGKSLRSLERSLIGRWGNKLPAGWVARKIKTTNGDEWRILPPPGFRLRQVTPGTEGGGNSEGEMSADGEYREPAETDDFQDFQAPMSGQPRMQAPTAARDRLRRPTQPWRASGNNSDQPTIVIDRSEEVEYLLRELVSVQKSLSEERRVHLDDMRLISQLQGSMRLLEVNANESHKLKAELEASKSELEQLKAEYDRLVKQTWWKWLLGIR